MCLWASPVFILHESFSRVFSSVCFSSHTLFGFLLFYHPSHPPGFLLYLSFDFIVVCMIWSLPFFPLVRLWYFRLFPSSFTFSSCCVLFRISYSLSGLAFFVFLLPSLLFHPCLSMQGSFVVAPLFSSRFPHIFPTETSTTYGGTFLVSCRYVDVFLFFQFHFIFALCVT